MKSPLVDARRKIGTAHLERAAYVYVRQSSPEQVRTNVEIVRRGLRLLQATTDRAELQDAYRRASKAVRAATRKEVAELDPLSGEGLD